MELIFILKKEIRMLRAGKFNDIHQVSLVKSEKLTSLFALMESLNRTGDGQKYKTHLLPKLARLKSLSIENGLLLSGVYNGVKSVRERILTLENSARQVGVYSRKGHGLSFFEEPTSHEKTL
jgi:hypothetical protein